ncbi:unnamed protein product [Caenorhabditis bovis]|uniref:SCP domain-containing protein n=1 Tax=Caenorhabditis bovis TaxID=2654633 RepID=A0A8S1FC62_9PELO|nr:unnamed protein product [Caenorhabditis bovis]
MLANGHFMSKPQGANLRKIYWNETLAKSAAKYAARNPEGHSGNKNVGENLSWHWATNPKDLNQYGKEASEEWLKEFEDFGWKTNKLTSQLFSSGIGHATQMVWADTYQIGCGLSTFDEKSKKSGKPIKKITVVCHYWPRGNFINKPIYIEGKPCSKCSKCDKNRGICI